MLKALKEESSAGYTLIELLVVVAVVAGLSAVGAMSYWNAYRRSLLDSTALEMQSYLRLAQQKAIGQEDGVPWGVHFENSTSRAPLWEIFSGGAYTSASVTQTIFLSGQMKYLTPSSGSIDVIFGKVTGIASTSPITLEVTNKSQPSTTTNKRTVTVNGLGVVSVQ